MPELVRPLTRVHASFLQAMKEFRAEGRGAGDDHTMIGRENREFGSTWDTPEGFATYVQSLLDEAREDAPRPVGMVPSTTLWYVDRAEYLGRLAIRHRLTPFLLDKGGHIGYDVRPTARRRGYATAMLAMALPVAHELGIERVLVTCDTDNEPSRRVIEINGGRFEDERSGKLRYWIDT